MKKKRKPDEFEDLPAGVVKFYALFRDKDGKAKALICQAPFDNFRAGLRSIGMALDTHLPV